MLTFVVWIVFAYLGILMLVYLFQEKLIFFPTGLLSTPYELAAFSDQEITIQHNGVQLHGWHIRPEAKNIIIYYGGNAEEVSLNLRDFIQFSDYSILLMNYRGYGKSEGRPGQDELFADALYIFDQIAAASNHRYEYIILFGRSLGSGIACFVASKRNVQGVILVTAYDSIVNIGRQQFPFLPVRQLLRHPFDSMHYAKSIKAPALVISAEHDRIIPYKNSENLIQHFSASVQPVVIKHTDHNTIQNSKDYWDTILTFIKRE